AQFRAYRATLQDDRRHRLERFEVVDIARKVVGVGSVVTRAFIALLQGRDAHDPLFLQVKEATASVLEPYVGKSRYKQHGERVVQGQRMMQAASAIYLGWTVGLDVRRSFYWRQLRGMEGGQETGGPGHARALGGGGPRARRAGDDPGPEPDPGPRAGAAPASADGGLGVELLPGRRRGDGRRPGHPARQRADGAAVRRRPRAELRPVGHAGAEPGVR